MTETKLTKVLRIILGLALIVFGLNGFLNFMPTPEEIPEALITFMTGVMAIKYFLPLLSICFLATGVMLLLRKWVPFALIVLAPISLNIILLHLFVDLKGIIPGLIILLLNVYLGVKYFDAFRPLFATQIQHESSEQNTNN